MGSRPRFFISWALTLAVSTLPASAPADNDFNFSKYLFGSPSTLTVAIDQFNPGTGFVRLNGSDTQGPTTPFTWQWDDGAVTSGFFPQSHTYSNKTRNYVVQVIANYTGGLKDTTRVVVRFVSPTISPIALPPELAVTIPSVMPSLSNTRLPSYGIPPNLTAFDNSFFGLVSRSNVEYVMSVAARIENDIASGSVFMIGNQFQQVMLRDPTAPGASMYSLWFTEPVSFGVGDAGMQTPGWSSFFHEMGHNISLNSPADYYLGGKIDGSANAICSEALAQIFQHATGFEMINHRTSYGLSEDLAADIRESAIDAIKLIRSQYEAYVAGGTPFASWNDPNTPADETFGTFMTLAYEFCQHAETSGLGYRNPAKWMMWRIQRFDPTLHAQYDQGNDTPEADEFRATFMVSAMSYGFGIDLRSEFRALDFPISDQIFEDLALAVPSRSELASGLWLDQNHPNPIIGATLIPYALPTAAAVNVSIYDVSGRLVRILVRERQDQGPQIVRWDGLDDAGRRVGTGVYFCRLEADGIVRSKRMLVAR